MTRIEEQCRRTRETEALLFMRFEVPLIMEEYWQAEWYQSGREAACWNAPAIRENVPEKYRASYQSGYADGQEEVRAAAFADISDIIL